MLCIQNVDLNYILLRLFFQFLFIIPAVVALVHYDYRSSNYKFNYHISAIISLSLIINLIIIHLFYLLCYYVSFLYFRPFPVVVDDDVIVLFLSLKLNCIPPLQKSTFSICIFMLHIIVLFRFPCGHHFNAFNI